MQIHEIMTDHPEYIPTNTTLKEAATRMRELDCGFLPLGDDPNGKLQGVITDRDITIRGVAEGLDPNSATVNDVKTDRVLYCFEDDDMRDVAHNMEDQQVYRMVVLDNRDDKKMCGIVTLGDILRRTGNTVLAGDTAEGITRKQVA